MPTKIRFKDGFQYHPERFLYDPVSNRRDAEGALPTIRFGHVRSAHGRWFKLFGLEIVSEAFDIPDEVLLEDLHVHAITTSRTTAGMAFDMGMGRV